MVVISHGGPDSSAYSPDMENGSWHLSKVAGVDAMLIGHSHQIFPDAASTVPQFNLPGVDKAKGTVNGVPTVMANYWGKHLGVIEAAARPHRLALDGRHQRHQGGRRSIQNADKTYVAADAAVAAKVDTEHKATITYVKTPIGTTDYRMSSYFADVGDPGAIQIVNRAQAAYVKDYIDANLPALKSLPVLSVSARSRAASAAATTIPTCRPATGHQQRGRSLPVPNTVYAVKVNGDEVKARLETAAKLFQPDQHHHQRRPAADQQLPRLQLRHVHHARPAVRDRRDAAGRQPHQEPDLAKGAHR